MNVYQKNIRAIAFYQREGFEIQHSSFDEATEEKECNEMATEIELGIYGENCYVQKYSD